MENNQNNIEEIFRDAFANHEMEVSSHVWAGVQSGIAAQGAAGTAATSAVMFKAAAVIGLTTVVAIGTVNEIKLQSATAPQNELVVIESKASKLDNETAQNESTEWDTQEEITINEKPIKTKSVKTKSARENTDVSMDVIVADIIEEEIAEGNLATKKSDNSVQLNEQSSNIEENSTVGNSTKETEANDKDVASNKSDNTPQPKAKEETPVDTPQNLEEEKEAEKVCSIVLAHQAMGYISPDGDGTNECFRIEDAAQAASFQITIFTREGVQVFQSRDPNFSWCGTDNFGNVLPNRTMCYYHIQASDENDIPYSKQNAKGSIQIFR